MRVVYEHCCGVDVHKKSVTACIITPEGKETRTFGTMVRDLLELADWLNEHNVTHVAMESTGVYWKPVYNVLEEEFEVWVINARHIKNVPGRKTDVKDAEWIADLLRHGLVRASFIPDRPQRELREVVRYRRRLIQQRAQMVNRIQKVLEGGNIKLASVATDIMGASGLMMLKAMVAGEEDPKVLADMAKGKLRDKIEELQWALEGTMGAHQRFMLDSQLRMLDMLDKEIAHLDDEVAQRVSPFEEEVQRVDEVPGIGRRNAEDILAELGTDMSRFPSAAHLASWAKVSPGNNESAGKRRSSPTGRGSPWLKSALTEAAQAAANKKNSYLAAQKRRLAGRRGSRRANIAVAHSILKSVYYMLRDGTSYRELGGNYFDHRTRHATVHRAVRRIERLGYKVSLEAA